MSDHADTNAELSALPILYSFRRCPYAMRARLAISASEIQTELREIVLREKAPEFLETSPKGTVPVLVERDGRVIEESLDIMLHVLGKNDPEQWLSSKQGTYAEMIDLIAKNDGPFKSALDRYKYPNRYENVDPLEAREKAVRFLMELNERLEQSIYLFGEKMTLADAAILPFVRQFANVDRAWFDAGGWSRVQNWLKLFLESERFSSVMLKYQRWQHGDPLVVFPEA